MKISEGKSRVPVLPKWAQLTFAALAGGTFAALVIFVLVHPNTPASSIAVKEQPATKEVAPVEKPAPVKEAAPAPVEEAPVMTEPESVEEVPAEEEAADAPVAEESAPQLPSTYIFEVRAGDSYTTIVRAAVTRYSADAGISLSPAQRVMVETVLVQAAGAPEVEVGQRIILSADDIATVIDDAQDLSDDELAAWQVFADQVDFDADDAPEPAQDMSFGADGAIDDGGLGAANGAGVSGAAGGGGGL